MRAKRIKNVSDKDVTVEVEEGVKMSLSPGSEVKNVRIQNLGQIREDVEVALDLGEINEVRTGKTRLFD